MTPPAYQYQTLSKICRQSSLALMALFLLCLCLNLGRLVERRVRHAAADVPLERGHRLLIH